jgi:hypothetical protein
MSPQIKYLTAVPFGLGSTNYTNSCKQAAEPSVKNYWPTALMLQSNIIQELLAVLLIREIRGQKNVAKQQAARSAKNN